MKTYEFNRRRVCDQTIYVSANSYQEALEKARDGNVDDASDDYIVSVAIRPLGREHYP